MWDCAALDVLAAMWANDSTHHWYGGWASGLRGRRWVVSAAAIDVTTTLLMVAQALQAALNRAVERRNLELFSRVGVTRQIAVDTLHQVVDAVLAGDSATAGKLLEQVQPESPDNTVATVSSCIGIALGLLDDTLTAVNAATVALPAGRWTGERAATDILALARKGKAFRSLDKLLIRQGGPQVLNGSALALAATVAAVARSSNATTSDTTQTLIR